MSHDFRTLGEIAKSSFFVYYLFKKPIDILYTERYNTQEQEIMILMYWNKKKRWAGGKSGIDYAVCQDPFLFKRV